MSAHVLPAGTVVPSVAMNPALVSQIRTNDGLADRELAANANVIPRGSGMSGGSAVRYWSFGPVTAALSAIYVFDSQDVPIDHPLLVVEVPGDAGYSPLHSVYRVVVTPAYAGELITTMSALTEAIAMGLVNPPVRAGTFIASPIVRPGTALEVGTGIIVKPTAVFAHGYTVDMFPLEGALGVQPVDMVVPTSQVSFLREDHQVPFDTSRPIFQATIPTSPPLKTANYTPLSVVLDVDLAPGVSASTITKDSDLFVRTASGELAATTAAVAHVEVTSSMLMLPLQFMDGAP